MPLEYTPRGFAVYAKGVDHYDKSWSVQESSLATEDCVWVGSDEQRAHLTVEGAVAMRDALNEFIESHS